MEIEVVVLPYLTMKFISVRELASNETVSPYANIGGEKHRCRIHPKRAHREGDRKPAKNQSQLHRTDNFD